MDSKTTMYVIYASDDTEILQGILEPMRSLEDDQKVKITLGEPIHSGKPWKPAQTAPFNDANIYVLLLSNAFMYSEFVKQLEFKKVIDRYKAEEAQVIPILLNQCPWDTNFEADEYTFSFSELTVLPENKNPISNWDTPYITYQQIRDYLISVLPSNQAEDDKPSLEVPEKKEPESHTEDQLAISFAEEKVIEEQERAKKELERKKAETEKKVQQQAEEQKRLNALEAEKRAEAERKRLEAEKAERIASEESAKEAAAKRRLEEEKRKAEAEEKAKLRAAALHREQMAAQSVEQAQDPETSSSSGSKKPIVIAAIVALLLIGFWAFWPSESTTKDSKAVETETDISDDVKEEVTETETKIATDDIEEDIKEPLAELTIGDVYEGGFVFEIDASGTTGKIAHLEDVGPMPWKDGMQIHVQLGDEWRMPTLDELRVMYQTIGQGASNTGEFADELYWSSTPFDEYQARLLRFRDGNTSYHYNKEVESRKFRIRAVRSFSR